MMNSFSMIDLKKKEAERDTCFVDDFSVEIEVTDKLRQEHSTQKDKPFYEFMVEKIETQVNSMP